MAETFAEGVFAHFRSNWEQHASAAAGTGTSLAIQGFSFGAVLQGIAVGVGVFLITTALKKLWQLVSGSPSVARKGKGEIK